MTIVAGIIWLALALSLLLPLVAASRDSWQLMLLAALRSLGFSVPTALSIGPYIWLLTNLQLASALGLRWRLPGRGRTIVVLATLLIWAVTVPLNLLVFCWPPLELLAIAAVLVAIVATLVGPRHAKEAHT